MYIFSLCFLIYFSSNQLRALSYYRLEKLLRGERNASDFLQWQSSMRQKDLEEELVEAEERRVKGKLSREEAILARQNNVKDKQDLVSLLLWK